jgi:hypothetical protein
MKLGLLTITFVSLAEVAPVGAQGTLGNGTFQDLDFETAALYAYPEGQPTSSAGMIYAAQAIPGWIASIGGTPLTAIGYNYAPVDQAAVTLTSSPGVIDGNYSVAIASGGVGRASPIGEIAQTGTVPVGANVITFVSYRNVQSVLTFSVNGMPVQYSAVTTLSSSFETYAADISQYAGRSATISFGNAPYASNFILDDIGFSAQQIPEASEWALIGPGIVGVFLKFRVYRQ